MSSLMVSNDLEIMMLEFWVQKLFVPKTSIFDSVILKKTTVMFRMLDYDWTALSPHRADYAPYRGSNSEEEDFHGGKSVVFAIPTSSLEKKMHGVDIQIHVRKEISRYFEMDSCQNVGFTLINVDDMFNGIIKELQERKELDEYLSCFHKRQPISRSLKGTYEILDEDQRKTGATITLYIRLSYFGKSVITEIERVGHGGKRYFYAQEETNETYPYQCKELKRSKLEVGCWGSETFLPPLRADCLTCHCDARDSMETHEDEKSDDSDEDNAGITDESARQYDTRKSSLRSSRDYEDRENQDNGKTRGNGEKGKKSAMDKKDKKGKKGVKDKGGVRAGKQGKKVKSDEKDVAEEKIEKRVSKVPDARQMKDARQTKDARDTKDARETKDTRETKDSRKTKKGPASGSAKKGGRTSKIGKIGIDDFGAVRQMQKSFSSVPAGDVVTEKMVSQSDQPKGMKKPDESAQKLIATKDDSKEQRTKENLETEITDATRETTTRRVQFRRRHRGIVTVGFQDKEKKMCLDGMESSALPEISQIPDPVQPTICTNLHSLPPFCYPTNDQCKTTLYLPLHCSMDTRNERSYALLHGRSGFMNIADMPILTN